jgi:tetratricopeptide (TPR) repeat protein
MHRKKELESTRMGNGGQHSHDSLEDKKKGRHHRSDVVVKDSVSGGNSIMQHLSRSHNRRGSTDAPVRATVAQKMVKTLSNAASELNQKHVNTADVSQYKMIEIEPPFKKSSRSAHFVSKGYLVYQEGNYINALNIFTKAIEASDKNWLAFFWRGVAFDKLGGYGRAIRDFTSSIKVRTRRAVEEAGDGSCETANRKKIDFEEPPELAAVYFNRGIVFSHVGDDESAESDFSSALKRDPANFVFRHNRALINRRFGKYKDAQSDYVKLWMERRVMKMKTSPCEENMRPVTMSGFRKNRGVTLGRPKTGGMAAIQLHMLEMKEKEEDAKRKAGALNRRDSMRDVNSISSSVGAAAAGAEPSVYGDSMAPTNLQQMSIDQMSSVDTFSGQSGEDGPLVGSLPGGLPQIDSPGGHGGKKGTYAELDSGASVADMSSIAHTELHEQPSILTMNDDMTVVRQTEWIASPDSKPMTSGIIEQGSAESER